MPNIDRLQITDEQLGAYQEIFQNAQQQAQAQEGLQQAQPGQVISPSAATSVSWEEGTSTWTRASSLDFSALYDAPTPRSIRISIKAKREYEVTELDKLIKTGVSELSLGVVNSNTILVVKGATIYDKRTMFMLSPTNLTVWGKRAAHLLPQLTRLAEREGVELEIVEEPLGTTNERSISFWLWRGEIDDMGLFQTKVAERSERSGRHPDDCECDDCYEPEEDYPEDDEDYDDD